MYRYLSDEVSKELLKKFSEASVLTKADYMTPNKQLEISPREKLGIGGMASVRSPINYTEC